MTAPLTQTITKTPGMSKNAGYTSPNNPASVYGPNSVNFISTRTYMAAPVPRNIRQKRMSNLPLDCVIGYRATKDDSGYNIVFDIVMLPVREFHRVKLLAGLQYSPTPTPSPRANAVGSAYVLTNVKTITAPDDATDAKAFAKAHFIKEFVVKI